MPAPAPWHIRTYARLVSVPASLPILAGTRLVLAVALWRTLWQGEPDRLLGGALLLLTVALAMRRRERSRWEAS